MLFFYQPEVTKNQHHLEGDEYQHCVKVLRKKKSDIIGILDGYGTGYEARITEITGSQCFFEVVEEKSFPRKGFYNHIAIAPTKSTDRTEWFVEKACELGVDEISFIHTRNAERNKLRTDRLHKKAVSALKQSKSGFLTRINELEKFDRFLEEPFQGIKLIGVVEPNLPYLSNQLRSNERSLILIGPEGDFDPSETEMAIRSGFRKVSLGRNTLRTETAGVVAAQMVNVANLY